jgi:micrococcal nuclease
MRLRRRRYEVPDAVTRQLRRRRLTRRGLAVALLVLALTTLLDRFGAFRYRGDDWGNFDRQDAVVTRVVDGDTVRVRLTPAAADEPVRLLGIDAPEVSRDDDAPGPAHWGPEAAAHLRRLLDGRTVTLRLDTTGTRDKYRRLLAYVYVGDGENVNLSLVRDGHAYAHRSFPHSLGRQFEQAEDEARGKGRGLWAGVAEAQMPAWRQRWLADRRQRLREPAGR